MVLWARAEAARLGAQARGAVFARFLLCAAGRDDVVERSDEHQGGVSVAQGGVSVTREKKENDGEEMAETSEPRGHFGGQRTGGEAAGGGIDHTTVTFRNPMRKKETEVI